MITYLPLILLAGVAAFVATPIIGALARRVGFVDHPRPHKIHVKPIPLMGGLAIYLALLVVVLMVDVGPALVEMIGVGIGATLLAVVGLLDDRRGLSPWVRLAAEVVAGAIVAAVGIRVDLFPWPVLNLLVTLFWIVGITNALNLMDNMDGLAAGVSAVAGLFFLVLASATGQGLVAALAAAVAGASLGFLYYNVNPAMVFMGDAGSLLLGFVLAVVGLKYAPESLPQGSTWMVPIVVLGLPIFDTTMVTYARWRARRPIFRGGGDHASHRLTRLGLGPTRAVLTLYLVAVALGGAAVVMTHSAPSAATLMFAALLLLGLVGVVVLERARPLPPANPPLVVITTPREAGLLIGAAKRVTTDLTVVLTENYTAEDLPDLLVCLATDPPAMRSWLATTNPHLDIATVDEWEGSLRVAGRVLFDGKQGAGAAAVLARVEAASLVAVVAGADPGQAVREKLAAMGERVVALGAKSVTEDELADRFDDILSGHRRKDNAR
jgi:UDP-GlcNAc:undecaprenyl-phosphate/decaprenyl-phosphate GlcNAc-1-phosphate transferase